MISAATTNIKYESIESTLNKQTFIKHAKPLLKPLIEGVLNFYINDEIIKFSEEYIKTLDHFLSFQELDIAKYKAYEIDFTNLLKAFLQRSKSHHSIYWIPMIGALYCLVALCQLAQDKNEDAQRNFFESYTYTNKNSIEQIAMLSSIYSALSGKPTTDDVFKAYWLNILFKRTKELAQKTEKAQGILTVIENMLTKKIDNSLKDNTLFQTKLSIINGLQINFDKWVNEKNQEKQDDKLLKKLQDQLMESKCIKYLEVNDPDMLSDFFACVIIDRLNECLNLKKHKKNKTENYKVIGDVITEALNLYVPFPNLIDTIINKIDNPILYQHLKIALEKMSKQITSDNHLFFLLRGDNDLKAAIIRLSPQSIKKPFAVTSVDVAFIKSAKNLAKPALLTLCGDIIKDNDKTLCSALLEKLFDNNYPSDKLYGECNEYICLLFKDKTFQKINHEYGPILAVLYYIACVSKIESGAEQIQTVYLNDAFCEPPQVLLDHLYLISAYVRLKAGWLLGAKYDLDRISGTTCHEFKEILNAILRKYIEKYPNLNVADDQNVQALLKELEISILNGDYEQVIKIQEKYENYDQHKISKAQDAFYNLLMAFFYLVLRGKTKSDNKALYDASLSIHLKESLSQSHLVSALFRFKGMITQVYGKQDKIYIQAFYDDLKNITADTNDEAKFRSLIFETYIADYCLTEDPLILDVQQQTDAKIITYQSIELLINKSDFIAKINKSIQHQIEKNIKEYIYDKELIKNLTDFFGIKEINDVTLQKYSEIEISFKNYVAIMLNRYQRYYDIPEPTFFLPVISALYYITGICQLAQNKNKEARFSFDECITYSNIEIKAVAVLGSTYSCLNGDYGLPMVIKARSYLCTDKFIEVFKSNEEIYHLFNLFGGKINEDLEKNIKLTPNEKLNHIDELKKVCKALSLENDENIAQLHQNHLLENIIYLDADSILFLFNSMIKMHLNLCYEYHSLGRDASPELSDLIVNLILLANQYISLNAMVISISKQIPNTNHRMHNEFKRILEKVRDKLKIDNFLDVLVIDRPNLDIILSGKFKKIKSFELNMTNEQFIDNSKIIAKPILLKICNDIKTEKIQFISLIDEFSNSKDYMTLEIHTTQLIKDLFSENSFSKVVNQYLPALQILFYINIISKMGYLAQQKDLVSLKAAYISEALYLLINHSKFKNNEYTQLSHLFLLTRSFIRFKRLWIEGGMIDLNDIPDNSPCSVLKKQIDTELIEFLAQNPTVNLQDNKAISDLIDQLRLAISNDDYDLAFKLQKQFELYKEADIRAGYKEDFHSWMTILHLKLHGSLGSNPDYKCSEMMLIELKKCLRSSQNFVNTIFHFKDVIGNLYPLEVKNFINLFNKEYKKLKDDHAFKIYYSLSYESYISEYCQIKSNPMSRSHRKAKTQEKNLIQAQTNETKNMPVLPPQKKVTSNPSGKNNKKKKGKTKFNKQIQKQFFSDISKIEREQAKQFKIENAIRLSKEQLDMVETKLHETNILINAMNANILSLKKEIHLGLRSQAIIKIKNLNRELADIEDIIKLNAEKISKQSDELLNITTNPIENEKTIEKEKMKSKLETEILILKERIYEIEIEIYKAETQLKTIKIDLIKATDNLINKTEDLLKIKLNEQKQKQDEQSQLEDLKTRTVHETTKLTTDLNNIEALMKVNQQIVEIEAEIEKVKREMKAEKDRAKIKAETEIEKVKNEIRESESKINAVKATIALKEDEIINKAVGIYFDDQRRLKIEREDERSRNYLNRFFSDPADLKTLSLLNVLAKMISRSVVFKGSLVSNFVLTSNKKNNNDINNIDYSLEKAVNDIDCYIDCIDTDYAVIRDTLLFNQFKIDNSDFHFINLSKELNNGLKLELTLKTAFHIARNPIPVTRGEAELIFSDDKCLPMFKVKENESFEAVCQMRKMDLEMPGIDTTNYAYRVLYKSVKGYRGIININNITIARRELSQYYQKTLAENRITIYLELSDFVTHTIDAQDNDAIKILKLIFNVFFDRIPEVKIDILKFVNFFISCKENLYVEDKKVFKEQIDLMVMLYSKNYELDKIRNEIENLKSLYLKSRTENLSKPELNSAPIKPLTLPVASPIEISSPVNPAMIGEASMIPPALEQTVEVPSVSKEAYEYQQTMLKITYDYHKRVLEAAYDYQQKTLKHSYQQKLSKQKNLPYSYPNKYTKGFANTSTEVNQPYTTYSQPKTSMSLPNEHQLEGDIGNQYQGNITNSRGRGRSTRIITNRYVGNRYVGNRYAGNRFFDQQKMNDAELSSQEQQNLKTESSPQQQQTLQTESSPQQFTQKKTPGYTNE